MASRATLHAVIGAGILSLALTLAMPLAMRGRGDPPKPPASLDKFELATDKPLVPEIAFIDDKGATRRLSEFRGRVVLLNLWATWCAPCIAELPDLARTQHEVPADRFAVVPINTMEKLDAAKLASFLQEHDAGTLPVYADPDSSAARALEGFLLPLTLLIDADGRKIGHALGAQKWDAPEALRYLRAVSAPKAPAR